jgi:hypothetical protein
MVAAGVIFGGGVVGATLIGSAGNLELFAVLIIGGIVAWRSKRGDFYKAVAEEKTEETVRLRAERDKLKELTDITPIVDKLADVTGSLERHAEVTEAVFAKVSDMNGSLRALTVAMEALADRLVLDEAARGLLAEASKDRETPRERQRRRTTS